MSNNHLIKNTYRISLLQQNRTFHTQSNNIVLKNAMIGLRHAEALGENHSAQLFYLDKIAFLYRKNGNYAQALQFYHRKLNLAEILNRRLDILDALYWQGVIYERTGYTHKAIRLLNKILSESSKTYRVRAFNGLCILYNNLENHTKAQEYINQSLRLIEDISSFEDIIDTYILASDSYFRVSQFLQATTYLEKAFSLSDERNIFQKRGIIYFLKGRIYAIQKQFEPAKEFLYRARDLLKINKIWQTLVHCNITLSQVYEIENNADSAIEVLEEALPIVEDLELIYEHKDICFQLQSFYNNLKLIDRAYEYLVKHGELKDLIHQRQIGLSKKKIKDKLTIQIEALQHQLSVKNNENRTLKTQLQHTQKSLTSLQEDKNTIEETIKTFAKNLRYPMNNIYRMAKILWNQYKNIGDSSENILLNFFLVETKQLDDYFTDLITYSKINRDKLAVDREISSIKYLLQDINIDIKQFNSKRRDVEILFSSDFPEIWVDEQHFKLLFTHFIFNIATLSVLEPNFMVEVSVKDEGNYYQFELVEMRMLDMFNRPEEYDINLKQFYSLIKVLDFVAVEGIGASLALCQKIVKFYNGKTWATFIKGKGFSFTFTIDKKELHFISEEQEHISSSITDTNQIVEIRMPPR